MRNIGVNIEKPEKTCEDKFCPYHGTLEEKYSREM